MRFEVHSCYGSKDISVLKQKVGKCMKLPLYSRYVGGSIDVAYMAVLIRILAAATINFSLAGVRLLIGVRLLFE